MSVKRGTVLAPIGFLGICAGRLAWQTPAQPCQSQGTPVTLDTFKAWKMKRENDRLAEVEEKVKDHETGLRPMVVGDRPPIHSRSSIVARRTRWGDNRLHLDAASLSRRSRDARATLSRRSLVGATLAQLADLSGRRSRLAWRSTCAPRATLARRSRVDRVCRSRAASRASLALDRRHWSGACVPVAVPLGT